MMPPTAYLSLKLLVLLTDEIIVKSKKIIMIIKEMAPISPVLEVKTEKIKSVCISGK